MPHTNITQEVQKVYTKQQPSEAVFVDPGETIDGHAIRVLQVTPEDKPAKKSKAKDADK